MKSGFITILGRPNVGKSTLMNTILHRKISIISPKPQTTRDAIQGIYTTKDVQMIFIDTPGIHKPNTTLGENMNHSAFQSTKEVEAAILIVDASEDFGEGDQYILDRINTKVPLFVVFNKIDLCTIPQVEALKKIYQEKLPDAKMIEISALKDANVDTLLKALEDVLEEGPQYFPSDMYSDHSDSFLIAEIIREKTLTLLRDEVPHSIAVKIEKLTRKEDEMEVHATIVCEKEGQKGIIIGKGGKMIKRIGTQSRYEIEKLFGVKCRLETFVRVEKDWRNSLRYLKEFGYNKD
ncbi:gTPase [Coprobacillus sp. CAG:826]|nr:GTPase Era [Coprobacillus sp.]CDD91260.1 gTPase [Coprobacillus sp. CAG:826]